MQRHLLFNISCGAVAMSAVGIAAMTWGHGGMAWTAPWMWRVVGSVVVEGVLMGSMGPAPATMLLAPFFLLTEDHPQLERALTFLLRGLVCATAMGLALVLLHLLPPV